MRKVEVFVAGCPVCNPVVDRVQSLACDNCEVVVYDLNAPCDSGVCLELYKSYGITSVPSVVVNGKVLPGCDEKDLRAANIGCNACSE